MPCVSRCLRWSLRRSSRECSGQQGESGQHSSCPFPRTSRKAGPRPQAALGRQERAARRADFSLCLGQVYIEDSLGERIWVDSPHCKTFVDNIQTAFNTRMPPKSMLLQGEAGRGGGDLSAGKSRATGLGPPPCTGPGAEEWVRGRGDARVHEASALQGAALTRPSPRRRTARLSC